MADVYTTIAARLANLKPPLKIEQYIGNITKVGSSTLDGISFIPKNRADPCLPSYAKAGKVPGRKADLLEAIHNARLRDGGKAFRGKKIDNEEHWALKMSFGVTKGGGFREPWRFPELSAAPLVPKTDPATTYESRSRDRYAASFGHNAMLPNLSSLHFAVHEMECNVHIDEAGFVLEAPNGNVSVAADSLQHIVNELLFKTYAKELAPKWANSFFDRVSLNYPHSGNNFDRMGPRINQVPLLRKLGDIPGIGPILGKVPLPGVSVDILKAERYSLKVNASCRLSGSCAATFSFGGVFE